MRTEKIIYSKLMDGVVVIEMNNPESKNTLTIEFLDLFEAYIDQANEDKTCKVVVIQGSGGYFCTGMDFGAVEERKVGNDERRRRFVGLLDKLVKIPKVTIAFVDGKSMAGGVGIAAACDFTVATSQSAFSLPEALWGLLPALILPYIVRRIGPHAALRMMVTGAAIDASEAKSIQLIDIVGGQPDLKRLCFKLSKIEGQTIAEAKQLLLKICPLDEKAKEETLDIAHILMKRQNIYDNMTRFRQVNQLPWE